MEQDQQPQRPLPAGGPETLERLLAWHARRSPDKIALVDPPNRDIVQNPMAAANERTYDFSALERNVNRLAAHFRRLPGTQPGDYVAVQLPNLSETYIVLLALLRARLVPCLLPLAWNANNIDRALDRLKPHGIVACGRIDGRDRSIDLRDAACKQMSVRFLLGIGTGLAEGFESLSPFFDGDDEGAGASVEADAPGINDLALITFADPITCVPHSHGQLLAAGLLHVKTLEITAQGRLLSAYAPSSLVGLATFACPWLIAGATLILHHPLDKALLQSQVAAHAASFFAGPEQLVAWLARSQWSHPTKLGLVWRHGHMPPGTPSASTDQTLFDLWNLGEIGMVPIRRAGAVPAGLFPGGRICLPNEGERDMCLAAGDVVDGSLHIRGRIFPNPSMVGGGLEWLGFKRLVRGDMIDTGIAAFEAAGDTILIGDGTAEATAEAAAE